MAEILAATAVKQAHLLAECALFWLTDVFSTWHHRLLQLLSITESLDCCFNIRCVARDCRTVFEMSLLVCVACGQSAQLQEFSSTGGSTSGSTPSLLSQTPQPTKVLVSC